MSATLNVAGLLMNLAGVILLFRYGMPYRVRTGGNELRFTVAADQDTVNAEQRQWNGVTEPVSKEEVPNERSTRGSIRRISQPHRISIAATAARCGGICVSG